MQPETKEDVPRPERAWGAPPRKGSTDEAAGRRDLLHTFDVDAVVFFQDARWPRNHNFCCLGAFGHGGGHSHFVPQPTAPIPAVNVP